MFSGFIDDFKVRLDLTLKAMIAGAIFAFALVTAFVCGVVVLFLWTMQTYGVMYAWGAVAAVFGVVALFSLIPLLSSGRKRRALAVESARRAAKADAEKSRDPEWWQNPAMLLTGLQIARTVGFRGLLPVLAIGAVAAGYFLSRQPLDEADTHVQPAE